MAIEMTNELLVKLLKAGSEQVEAVLKEEGIEATQDEIDRIKAELDGAAEHDGEALSLDELDAVAGGLKDWVWNYWYDEQGCAATVEFGSKCYGVDGGCDFIHNHYIDGPVNVKCSCGHYMYKKWIDHRPEGEVGVLRCPYCNSTLDIDPRVWSALERG